MTPFDSQSEYRSRCLVEETGEDLLLFVSGMMSIIRRNGEVGCREEQQGLAANWIHWLTMEPMGSVASLSPTPFSSPTSSGRSENHACS
jgi:hypothetical protein